MKVLVINAGSSSLKYQLIDMADESVIAKGVCERIGESGVITHKANGLSLKRDVSFPTHKEAIDACVAALTTGEGKVINSVREISAVGHRVVQGGDIFHKSCLIDDDVMRKIGELGALAPLHNPAHLLGIKACRAVLGDDVPQVAVFDTAFHQTIPPVAYTYALPYEYTEKYDIRRYGFHGTSHRYVSSRCAELLGNPEHSRIITCHLGNGCSVATVVDGKCVDTSMGFTPLDGLVMGTRCGSVDPSAITYLMEKENLTAAQTDEILNKKSGLLGVSGVSNDSRDVETAANAGNKRAALAFEMQEYSILKTVGSYIAVMGGADAIVFTGGIGENNPGVREYVCRRLEFMGLTVDAEKNKLRGQEAEISVPGSRLRAFVIPTDEELVIARDTAALTEGKVI